MRKREKKLSRQKHYMCKGPEARRRLNSQKQSILISRPSKMPPLVQASFICPVNTLLGVVGTKVKCTSQPLDRTLIPLSAFETRL